MTPGRVRAILEAVETAHPDARCSLGHESAFELLVATILSAQCTDERVNRLTPALFRRYPRPDSFADAPLEELMEAIRPTGFFRNKARAIQGASRILVDRHGGRVPSSMEALLELPGVARKTANVVLGTAFAIPSGIAVDTHVFRVARRLGMSREKTPEKVERDLMALVPRERWIRFGHQLILHGRRVCAALKPRCEACTLRRWCDFYGTAAPGGKAGARRPTARKAPARRR